MAKPEKHYGKWRVRWIDEKGKRRSATFDTYKEAITAQARKQTEVEEIKEGTRAPDAGPVSFSHLCDIYLEQYSSQKRRQRDDIGVIKNHLRPFFGEKLLSQINWETETNRFKVERQYLNDKTVHNHLTLLKSMLFVAKRAGWIKEVPTIKKPKIHLLEADFSYLRTDDEIRRFLTAAKAESDLAFALYATTIYTGMRQGEIAGLKWEDINFERRLITIQRSFDGPTKSGRIRQIPILDPLLPILKAWRLKSQSYYVFPSESGAMQQPSGRIFQEVFHRVLDCAEFPRIQKNGKTRRYVVFHDLRHTFASHWMMKGGDIFRLQKILGHRSVTMTERYSHLAPGVFAQDYSRFGTEAPISTDENVIPFPASG